MLTSSLEAILFASAKPLSIASLRTLFDVSEPVLREAIDDVSRRFNTDSSGIHLVEHEGKVQFVTSPEHADLLRAFLKQEVSGELTRPSLETLTIIAYRGPITKPEMEQIRGVNCTLILRNLLMRGLIEERDDAQRLQPVYTVSTDFLRHLGLHSISDLPSYDELNQNEKVEELMSEAQNSDTDIPDAPAAL